MDNDMRQEWAEELRNGNYPQGSGKLLDDEGGYCCLGVLAEGCLGVDLRGRRFAHRGTLPPGYDQPINQDIFIMLNDNYRADFDEIAYIVESGFDEVLEVAYEESQYAQLGDFMREVGDEMITVFLDHTD